MYKNARIIIVAILISVILVIPVLASTEIFSETIYQTGNFTQVWDNGTFRIYPVVQGNTSMDGVDISLSGTVLIPFKSGGGATWQAQRITPTKLKISGISVSLTKTGSPTGNLLVAIETDVANAPSGVILSSALVDVSTFPTAVNGYTNVTIPTNCTGEKLWVTFKNQSAWVGTDYPSMVVGSGTAADRMYGEGAFSSNIAQQLNLTTHFAKNTEDVDIDINGVNLALRSNGTAVGDPMGILSGAIVDTDTGTFTYENGFNASSPGKLSDVFSATAGGYTTAPVVINGWGWTNTSESIQSASDATARNVIFKVNTMLPIQGVDVTATAFNNNVATGDVSISGDNINYVSIWDIGASASQQTQTVSSNYVNGNYTLYVKLSKDTTNGYIRWDMLNVTALIDTSGIPEQTYINGTNYVNVSSTGQAVSSSFDPSELVDIRLMARESEDNIPIAISSLSRYTVNVPGYTWFNDTSLNTPTSWNWSWGDGTYAATANGTKSFWRRGIYNVSSCATNDAGTNCSYNILRAI